MKNPILLLTLCTLIVSTACQKEEKSFTQISGVVYDKNSNPRLPVANAQVFFEWREPLTYGAFTHHIDSTRSDAQGRYSIAAETPNENLHIYANGPAHFPEGALTMGANVQRGKKQTINLGIIPHAWVRMNIRKTGRYDYMNINPIQGSVRDYTVYSDTLIITRGYGNTEITIPTFKYKGGTRDLKQYYIQTNGCDTVDITIDF